MLKKIFFAFVLSLYFSSCALGFENAFYIMRSTSPASITKMQEATLSFKNHYKSIHILISQAYQVNEKGTVWGFVDPQVLNFAQKNSVKLMILITNAGFNKEKVHIFLSDPAAQKKAIESILEACIRHHYYGVQMDFEMVPLSDRAALTQFFSQTAAALHKQHFAVSYAVAPTLEELLPTSDFQKKIYENWEGAFDLKALGQSADFVSVMAYGQHAGITTPGPTASLPWVEAALKYVSKFVPAEKISLGIPVFSTYWFTTNMPADRINMQMADIGYNKVVYLLNKYNAKLIWNEQEQVNYTFYPHDWLNEFIFVEDEKSFHAKLELAKKYNLRGISVYEIGLEDPKIWDDLKS